MNAIKLKELVSKGLKVKIFDIRAKDKYDNYHIKGAINVPKGELLGNYTKYFDKKDKVYITCNSGNSASLIVNIIKNDGYDVENVKDGMNPLVAIKK